MIIPGEYLRTGIDEETGEIRIEILLDGNIYYLLIDDETVFSGSRNAAGREFDKALRRLNRIAQERGGNRIIIAE